MSRRELDRAMLSVVVPVYDEEEALPELEKRLAGAVEGLGFDRLEFLLVSDGSRDGSEEIIRAMVERDPRYKGVFLSRNFGHQAAIGTGLGMARGSVVAIIDGDLQDPPEAIAALIETLDRGADVAYGVRTRRKESLPARMAYATFYRVLRAVSAIEIPLDSGDFCCMRRPVVDAMLALPEQRRFLRGLRAWVGFRQVGVPYERAARHAGAPKYTLRKLIALAYDGLFSFSSLPIRVMQLAGFVLSALAIGIAIFYIIWSFLAPERFPSGFASLIVSIWFFAGVQLLCLGIVGEYVVRTCDESRGRPQAIIREVVARSADSIAQNDPESITSARMDHHA